MTDLSITSGSGSQTSTQSPQGLVSTGTRTEAASTVQPGTASTLLSPNTISLNNTRLSIVNLNISPTTAKTSKVVATDTAPPKHHTNYGLLSVSIVLLVVALYLFWMTTRSAKSTTDNH